MFGGDDYRSPVSQTVWGKRYMSNQSQSKPQRAGDL